MRLALKGSQSTCTPVRVVKVRSRIKSPLLFASSSRMQMSQERKNENGALPKRCECFLKNLTPLLTSAHHCRHNGDGYINTGELNDYISKYKIITNGQQTPKATIENGRISGNTVYPLQTIRPNQVCPKSSL